MKQTYYISGGHKGDRIEIASGSQDADGTYSDLVVYVAKGQTVLGKTYDEWKALIGIRELEL